MWLKMWIFLKKTEKNVKKVKKSEKKFCFLKKICYICNTKTKKKIKKNF